MNQEDHLRKHYESAKKKKNPDLSHPTDDELFRFTSGLINDALRKTIEEHLAECPYCLNEVAELVKLNSIADDEESSAQDLPKRIREALDLPNIGELVLGFAHRITKIVKTTGTPSMDILAMARGGTSNLFDDAGTISYTFGRYRCNLTIERQVQSQSVTIYIRDTMLDQSIDGANVQLKNGVTFEAVTEEGTCTFSRVPLSKYVIRIRHGKEEIGAILLELRQLTVGENLEEARLAIENEAYSKAEDFLTTVLEQKEDSEALELAAIVRLLREVDSEGFRSDAATRGGSVVGDRMAEATIGELKELFEKIHDQNPIFVEAMDAVLCLHRREFDKAKPIFERLTKKISDSPIGQTGVSLITQADRPSKEGGESATTGLDQAIRQVALQLTDLVKKTGELNRRMDTLEGKINILLSGLNDLKSHFVLDERRRYAEDEIHAISEKYSKAIVQHVDNSRNFLTESYKKAEAKCIAELGGKKFWELLDRSQLFIQTAEFIFDMLNQAKAQDYSPAAMEYVKAFETFLNEKIFWNSEAWLDCSYGDKACIRKRLKSDFDQRDRLNIVIKILEDDPGKFVLAGEYTFSCGEMVQVFAEMQAKSEEWGAYRRLTQFLRSKSERFFERNFRETLLRLAREYRNGAVHYKAIDFESCKQCRNLVLSEIKLLIKSF